MDQKSRQIIAVLRKRIESGNYGETDVLALFVSVREYAQRNSAVRELGDFLVHREKDRGAIRAYVDHIAKFVVAQKAKDSSRLTVAPIYTAEELFRNLRDLLRRLDLPPFSMKQSTDCLACIMVILQGVRIADGKKELGRLHLAFNRDAIWLTCTVPYSRAPEPVVDLSCPALIVPNKYCGGLPAPEVVAFPGLATFACRDGEPRILSIVAEC